MDLIDRKAVFVSLCEDCMIKYHGECPHPASRCIEYRKIKRIPEAVDAAKILRLLDEADDIVSALYRQGANKDYKCKSLREKLKEIGKELTGNAAD